MIPLHAFNAAKVLEGARVPLVCEEQSDLSVEQRAFLRQFRSEWVRNTLIEIDQRAGTSRLVTIYWDLHAIDPTDEDTARLIDRRIAEAMSWPDLYAAQLISARVPGGEFGIAVLLADGFHCGAFATERFTAPLRGLPATTENLPEARARLLCALYPPEAK